eukprot:TRINITY_DN1174_c0_g1_i1.p1 TRINITY_DN1174_c0_g1~~TRINITY_DN1174_c0_g1_i1.p1  ORF type:complete len:684 (-),score=129.34 TRINITY_DN1174_c0_g1_i1:1950-3899(-)
MDEIEKKHPNMFFPVSRQWEELIHMNHDFGQVIPHFRRSEPIESRFQLLGSEESPFETPFLRRKVAERITPETPDKMKFPGPMAKQLGRADLHLLAENQYFITEKSDGIRCMMLSVYEPSCPQWMMLCENAPEGIPDKRYMRLFDNLSLEAARTQMVREGRLELDSSINVQLSCGMCKLEYQFGASWSITLISPRLPGAEDDDVELLRPIRERFNVPTTKEMFMHSKNIVDGHPQIILRRNENAGWHFSYIFDRRFEFYLCEDHFRFMVPHPMAPVDAWLPHNILILDGEVVENIPQQRLNYSIYDLICCNIGGMMAMTEGNLARANMDSKVGLIASLVVEPHHKFYHETKKVRIPLPTSLCVVRKHFYPKERVEEVLSCINELIPGSGEYVYKGYNRNDGLVFTPASYRLYSFKPGLCPALLKWKWTEKLTVDFLIRDRRKMFWTGPRREIECVRENGVALLGDDDEDGAVVECSFDKLSGEWNPVIARSDKDTPNSFVTAIATLIGIVEGISKGDLVDVLLGRPSTSSASVDHSSDVISREFAQNHRLSLEIQAEHWGSSQWNVVDSSGTKHGRALVDGSHAYRSGSIASFYYSPSYGAWRPFEDHVHAEIRRSSPSDVFHHLEGLAVELLKDMHKDGPSSLKRRKQ